MKAVQAREMALKNQIFNNGMFQNLIKEIRANASQGKFEYILSDGASVTTQVAEKLEELGYDIEIDNTQIIIKW